MISYVLVPTLKKKSFTNTSNIKKKTINVGIYYRHLLTQ